MKLTELIEKEGVFFERVLVANPESKSGFDYKFVPVNAVAVGGAKYVKMFRCAKKFKIEEQVLNVRGIPQRANAYVLGQVGDFFQDGSFPVCVQYYHKL